MNLILLVKLREEKGLSQEKMAHLLGYKSKGSYSMIESGKTKVHIELANKLCSILTLNNDDIIQLFFTQQV